MARLQNSSEELVWIIDSSIAVPIEDTAIQSLLAALQKANTKLAISEFLFTKIGLTDDFNYRITLKDERIWRQTIQSGLNPKMTFIVQDFWKLSEFAQLRTARDSVIVLREKYEISRIIFTWA